MHATTSWTLGNPASNSRRDYNRQRLADTSHRLFRAVLSNGLLGPRLANKVLPAIMLEVYLKRTASSVIDRPAEYGGPYLIGSDIPPYIAHTVLVEHRPYQQSEHNTVFGHHIPKLFQRSSNADARADFVDNRTNTNMDMARLRALCHAGFCPVLSVLDRAIPSHRNTIAGLREVIDGSDDQGLSWFLGSVSLDPHAVPAMVADAEAAAMALAIRAPKLEALAAICRAHCIQRRGKFYTAVHLPSWAMLPCPALFSRSPSDSRRDEISKSSRDENRPPSALIVRLISRCIRL